MSLLVARSGGSTMSAPTSARGGKADANGTNSTLLTHSRPWTSVPFSWIAPTSMGGIATCGLSHYNIRPQLRTEQQPSVPITAAKTMKQLRPNKKSIQGSKGHRSRVLARAELLQKELTEVVSHRTAISEVLRCRLFRWLCPASGDAPIDFLKATLRSA